MPVFQNMTIHWLQALYKIEKTHPKMPFSLREIDDTRVRLGITECVRHELLQPHPVLYEKEGEIVAQVLYMAICCEYVKASSGSCEFRHPNLTF
jgi:hypothetical protein